jgi:hypothetical protein
MQPVEIFYMTDEYANNMYYLCSCFNRREVHTFVSYFLRALGVVLVHDFCACFFVLPLFILLAPSMDVPRTKICQIHLY